MYTLFKNVGVKKIVIAELPSLGISLLVAEEFYKFGSFITECFAFLATWYLISLLVNTVFPKSTT
jgi:hypothetical protein